MTSLHRVPLHFREYGQPVSTHTPLLLLHGLFGSAGNWHSIARSLEGERHIVVPDLRNHGRSPHSDDASYPAMTEDVVGLMEQLGLERAAVIGHSMGGKLAMWLALTRPEKVDQLVIADIAPVRYPDRFSTLVAALRRLPLAQIHERSVADARLAADIPDAAVRGFLLQNLVRGPGGAWQWRINLAALEAGLAQIADFPTPGLGAQFLGKTLFLYGGRSDYVQPSHEHCIRQYFPYARLRAIAGAGHWLYAEQPAAFVEAVRGFLG